MRSKSACYPTSDLGIGGSGPRSDTPDPGGSIKGSGVIGGGGYIICGT